MINICKHYKHPRGCTCKIACAQQLLSNRAVCASQLYYTMGLEQECKDLKERLDRVEEDLKYQCVDCMNVKSDRCRKALEEIEECVKEYVDNKELYNRRLNKILNIINKVKEKR